MSGYADRIELARDAFRADAPTDDDVRRAVRRIRSSLHANPPAPRRRFVAFAAAMLVLIAGLCYAATSQPSDPSPPTIQPSKLSHHLPVVVPPPLRPATAPAARAPADAPPKAERSIRTPSAPVALPPAEPTWADVSRAMTEGDEETAKRALVSIEKTGDAATRAKAKLGLAKLALANGDDREAIRLAREVAATEGLESGLVARALRIERRASK